MKKSILLLFFLIGTLAYTQVEYTIGIGYGENQIGLREVDGRPWIPPGFGMANGYAYIPDVVNNRILRVDTDGRTLEIPVDVELTPRSVFFDTMADGFVIVQDRKLIVLNGMGLLVTERNIGGLLDFAVVSERSILYKGAGIRGTIAYLTSDKSLMLTSGIDNIVSPVGRPAYTNKRFDEDQFYLVGFGIGGNPIWGYQEGSQIQIVEEFSSENIQRTVYSKAGDHPSTGMALRANRNGVWVQWISQDQITIAKLE